MMTFRLTKKAEVCVICGQSPSLSELENEVGQTFTVSLICLICHCLNCEVKRNEFNTFIIGMYFLSGQWFSPGTLVSSTNKFDRHNITEILLKVALNTINQTKPSKVCFRKSNVIYNNQSEHLTLTFNKKLRLNCTIRHLKFLISCDILYNLTHFIGPHLRICMFPLGRPTHWKACWLHYFNFRSTFVISVLKDGGVA